MKKKILLFFVTVLMAVGLAATVCAAQAVSVDYDLSTNGMNSYTREAFVKSGDTIEVTFTVKRTDASGGFSINSLQNYVTFDANFFQYVSGSEAVKLEGASVSLEQMLIGPRVFMTDMLDNFSANQIVGSFKLKVIGTTGSGMVKNGTVKAYDSTGEAITINSHDLKVSIGSTCPRNSTCPISSFTDTTVDFWWHDGIHYCLEKGLMNGIGNSKFNPNGTTTRAMIVTILWRLQGSPAVKTSMSFKDVPTGQWYTEAIKWAQSVGVVKGYSNTAFGPNDTITREQLATILYRYADLKGYGLSTGSSYQLEFADCTKIHSWAKDAVLWCNMNGIVNGKSNNLFDPIGNATRAESATMIQRFCERLGK